MTEQIRIAEMAPGVRYVITRGSPCKSIRKGDHARIYSDGTLGIAEARGWLEPADVAEIGANVRAVVDAAWADRRKLALQAQMTEIEKLLDPSRLPRPGRIRRSA